MEKKTTEKTIIVRRAKTIALITLKSLPDGCNREAVLVKLADTLNSYKVFSVAAVSVANGRIAFRLLQDFPETVFNALVRDAFRLVVASEYV